MIADTRHPIKTANGTALVCVDGSEWAIAALTGVIALVHRFDEYPFGLLGIILAAEAIFITGFILISNNRQMEHADKRAKLDYEVNVRTYREINEIDGMLKLLLERLDGVEAALRDVTRL